MISIISKLTLFALTIIILSSWSHQRQLDNDEINSKKDIKLLKNIKTFYYQVSDEKDSIGYSVFKNTGEIISISDIKIVNDYAFLSDPVHGNIKRIDLRSGIMKASVILNKDLSWISSLSFFNDLLHVFTIDGKVFLFDINLNYKGNFSINTYSYIYVYTVTKDELIVYRYPSDIYQNNGNYLKRIIIDKSRAFRFDTISLNNNELLALLRRENGKEVLDNDSLVFETNDFKFEIPGNLEKVKDYQCKNVDYSDNYIVTFTVDKQRLLLRVYEY